MSGTLAGPHGHDFSALSQVLAGFRGERVVFVPEPGNAGDNLLNLGAYLLMERLGLDWEPGTRAGVYPGRVVIYGGGGSHVPLYPSGGACLAANHAVARALVLLPHTVRIHGEIFAEMDARCHLFARDAGSLAYLRGTATGGAAVHDGHDLAFLLDDATVAGLPWPRGELLRPGRRGAWARMLARHLVEARTGDGCLRAYRVDGESAGRRLPPRNADLSKNFATGAQHRAACVAVAKVLRRVIQLYDRVETDRLHVALYSAILGKPVRMLDNSYGKNRAVWAQSLAGRFPGVAFEGAEDGPGAAA